MPILTSVAELDLRVTDLAPLPPFRGVALADPAEFDVAYAINPHMLGPDGELQQVDRTAAREQWEALRGTLAGLGLEVTVEPALPGHLDFVFCANPGLPVPAEVAGGPPRWVSSRMAAAERAGEVAVWERVFAARGWRIEPLEGEAERFEGTGDGLWHPRRRLLWGGVGPRTDRRAWEELAERYDLPVVTLELADPAYYHLDTCLAPLDERTCLWTPGAFAPEGQELVRELFEEAIEVPDEEARGAFACNAWAPDPGDGRRPVLLQRGAPRTVAALAERGFEVLELETGEFLKSGGSVFCMKLAHP